MAPGFANAVPPLGGMHPMGPFIPVRHYTCLIMKCTSMAMPSLAKSEA